MIEWPEAETDEGDVRKNLRELLHKRERDLIEACREGAPISDGGEGTWLTLPSRRLREWLRRNKSRCHDVLVVATSTGVTNWCLTDNGMRPVQDVAYEGSEPHVLLAAYLYPEKGCPRGRTHNEVKWMEHIDGELSRSGLSVGRMVRCPNGPMVTFYFPLAGRRMYKPRSRTRPQWLLVSGLTGLGDSVWLTAIVRKCAADPSRPRISVVVPPGHESLFEGLPEVSKVFPMQSDGDARNNTPAASTLLRNILAMGGYDRVIPLTYLAAEAAIFPRDNRPLLEHYGALAGVSPCASDVKVPVSARDVRRVQSVLTGSGIAQGQGPIVGTQFRASTVNKSWPQAFGHKLQGLLAASLGCEVLDVDALHERRALLVNQLAIAIGKCDLFVGVDSLGGHLAAASRRPSVTLYGLSRPRWRNNCQPLFENVGLEPPVECTCKDWLTPCGACLSELTPEQVTYGVMRWIRQLKLGGKWQFPLPRALEWAGVHETVWAVRRGSGVLIYDGPGLISGCDVMSPDEPDETDIGGRQSAEIPLEGASVGVSSGFGVDVFVPEHTLAHAGHAMLSVSMHCSGRERKAMRFALHGGWNYLAAPIATSDAVKLEGLRVGIQASATLAGPVVLDRARLLQRMGQT